MPTVTTFARACHRLVAVGAAALVLTLTLLAASPEAHEHVHHGCTHDDTHTCAVVLFAQGFWTSLDVLAVPAPDRAWTEFLPSSRPELRLESPPHLHPPERGPPPS